MDFVNRGTVTFGREQLELAASNGACVIYAEEFAGKVTEPYVGRLRSDILAVYQEVMEAFGIDPKTGRHRPLMGPDGSPVPRLLDDGTQDVDPDTGEPLYLMQPARAVGYEDVPQVVGIVWAMARAAGSTKLGYTDFRDRFYDVTSPVGEFDGLFDALVMELAQGTFFRRA